MTFPGHKGEDHRGNARGGVCAKGAGPSGVGEGRPGGAGAGRQLRGSFPPRLACVVGGVRLRPLPVRGSPPSSGRGKDAARVLVPAGRGAASSH